MIDRELNEAVILIQEGNRAQALPMMTRIITANPHSEKAWIWLAVCINDEEERLECLRKALEINPNNDRLRKTISKLEASNNQPYSESHPKPDDPEPQKQNKNKAPKSNPSATENKIVASNNNLDLPDLAIENIKKILEEKKQDPQEVDPLSSPTEEINGEETGENISQKDKSEKDGPRGIIPGWKPIKVNFREPEFVARNPEDDFFNGFKGRPKSFMRSDVAFFSKRFLIDGVLFSVYDGPVCVQRKKKFRIEECDNCEFFSPLTCLLKFDINLFDDIERFSSMQREKQERIEKIVSRSRKISELIYDELKAHGRPLHFTVITRIIKGRFPKIRITEQGVQQYLRRRPHLFERVDQGVYQAR